MEYFVLTISQYVKNPIRIKGFQSNLPVIDYEDMKELAVGYMEEYKETEITDILVTPFLMVSKPIRDLFSLYDTKMEFKGVQLFGDQDGKKVTPLYFVPQVKSIDCLHKSVKINPNSTINEVVLDKDKLNDAAVFKLDRIVQQIIIISLDVAESLLRRELYGIGLEKVRIL